MRLISMSFSFTLVLALFLIYAQAMILPKCHDELHDSLRTFFIQKSFINEKVKDRSCQTKVHLRKNSISQKNQIKISFFFI